jgi:HlyD family secretion protein
MTGKDSEGLVFYGTAEADQTDISAEISGRIEELKVEEGQKVVPESIVAIIDTPESEIRERQSGISVENAVNELLKVKEGSREEEINIQKAMVRQGESALKQAEAAVSQAEASVGQMKQSMNTASETYRQKNEFYEKTKALFEKDAATEQEVDNAEYAATTALYALDASKYSYDMSNAQLKGAKAQADSVKSQLAASKEKLALLINGATERTVRSAEYGVAQAEQGLELSKLTLGKSQIKAYTGGVVDTVYFSRGEYVTAGSTVMTLRDLNSLWVKVYIPERALTSVSVGKEVKLRSDFLKDKTIKGQVVYISPEAEFTPVNIVTKEDRLKLVFGVKVKILDNLESIKPGMLLDVDMR